SLTRWSSLQSPPTSAAFTTLTEPVPGTRTVAGPAVVMRTALRLLSPQMTVVPAPNTSRPPSRIVITPYVPGARSQRWLPTSVSPVLQSSFSFTRTDWPGLQDGKGRVMPHATATSPASTLQFSSQLGCPSPSRSPRIGRSNGSEQSAFEPGCAIIPQVG